MANILVVEEDLDIRYLLTEILEEANYNPVVKDEAQALEFLALPFDLVIVDDGRPGQPYGEHHLLIEKLAAQCQPVVPVMRLAKPFDMGELLAAVGQMVAQ